MSWFLFGGVCLVVLTLLLMAAQPLARWLKQRETRTAIDQFRVTREHLEASFFQRASSLGTPRDLEWLKCDWQPDVTFARDVESRLLTAFVSVNVQFRAIEGGDMEDVAAVSTVRDAAAVFHYNHGVWGTGGRALFNMNPQDAVNRLEGQFESISDSS